MATTGRIQVAPGQTISSSSWGNPVWDQSINCFASTADRDTQWPAPHEGSHCVTVDTGSRWVYRNAAWHGTPMGFLATLNGPATQTDITTSPVMMMTLSVNVVAGRWYRVTAYCNGSMTVAGNPRIGAYAGAALLAWATATQNAAVTQLVIATGVGVFQAVTTGVQTFYIGGNTTAGTMRFAAGASTLTIEDMGS